MTNWHRTTLIRLLQLADLAVVAAAFLSAAALAAPGNDDWFTIQVRNVLFVAGYLAYCHFVFHGFGLYRSYRLSPSSREWYDLAWAVLTATVPLWAFADLPPVRLAPPPLPPVPARPGLPPPRPRPRPPPPP